MENLGNLCPCFSGKEYDVCCKPFHQGTIPENALLLMRSRYSAYALNIPEYIIETTHPASPQYSDNKFSWRRNISQFARHFSFQNLKILDFKERDTLAIVSFTAYMSQEGQDATFTEKSYFEKSNKRWFYRAGQLAQGHVPNLITTGQFRLLPLAYYGDPILKRKADLIPEITSSIRKLIEEMIETMDACDGIGLAAPQIHHSIRLFVIRKPIEMDENTFEPGEVKVFINPSLSLQSTESWKAPEGCLSIPTIRSSIERPKEVTVEYTTVEGNRIKERISGWEARVVMHEYDHIEGILFIDRLEPDEQLKLMPFLQNLEKRMRDHRAL
jgi:peptide deformylase